MDKPTNDDLFRMVHRWAQSNFNGQPACELFIRIRGGGEATFTDIPYKGAADERADRCEEEEPFVPKRIQAEILEALDGRALRTTALANKLSNRTQMYEHPGGMRELLERGLVKKHSRLGYYRPDEPPPELGGREPEDT